jgi:hypothetical protein
MLDLSRLSDIMMMNNEEEDTISLNPSDAGW